MEHGVSFFSGIHSYVTVRLVLMMMVMTGLAGCQDRSPPAAETDTAVGGVQGIKIGFLVKQPESSWFQHEWKFAEQAGREHGFTVIKLGTPNREKVLAAIDTLAAERAQGFVICAPDPKLGPAIVAKAKEAGLKVIAVDDQFIGVDGQPMEDVPYFGISARQIGEDVGAVLASEMKKRSWTAVDTAVCAVTFDELVTTKQRTDGSIRTLLAAGFPAQRIYRAPQRTTDVAGAFEAVNALLAKHADIKHWLVCGINDNAVLGAVRALEERGYAPGAAIGIGIDGVDCIPELEKAQPTSFYGSMLLQTRIHGYQTAEMLYRWIKDGMEPPLETRTGAILITRGNYRRVLKEQGFGD